METAPGGGAGEAHLRVHRLADEAVASGVDLGGQVEGVLRIGGDAVGLTSLGHDETDGVGQIGGGAVAHDDLVGGLGQELGHLGGRLAGLRVDAVDGQEVDCAGDGLAELGGDVVLHDSELVVLVGPLELVRGAESDVQLDGLGAPRVDAEVAVGTLGLGLADDLGTGVAVEGRAADGAEEGGLLGHHLAQQAAILGGLVDEAEEGARDEVVAAGLHEGSVQGLSHVLALLSEVDDQERPVKPRMNERSSLLFGRLLLPSGVCPGAALARRSESALACFSMVSASVPIRNSSASSSVMP